MGEPAMTRKDHFTYQDYSQWPEDERWELIHGEAYEMGAPTTTHQAWVGKVFYQLMQQLKGKACKPFLSPVDTFPLLGVGDDLNAADSVVQPDVLIACDRDQILEKGIVGPPAWCLEVLSPSTSFKDQTQKLSLFEEAGVREYWLFNPVNYHLLIYCLAANGRYGPPRILVDRQRVELTALPGVAVDFTENP